MFALYEKVSSADCHEWRFSNIWKKKHQGCIFLKIISIKERLENYTYQEIKNASDAGVSRKKTTSLYIHTTYK